MCLANVDMAITTLYASGEISKKDTYKDETYFVLKSDKRKLVDNHAKEICLATRFLSLSSNKLHSQCKQELKNDIVKGDDKYPRSVTATLSFFQHHILCGHSSSTRPLKGSADLTETAFAQEGESKPGNDKDKPLNKMVAPPVTRSKKTHTPTR